MFDLSIEKILVLGIVALFIIGPERLPAAASWIGKTLQSIRKFSDDARQKVEENGGTELQELTKPLAELREPLQALRSMQNPRSLVADQVLGRVVDRPRTSPLVVTTPPGPMNRGAESPPAEDDGSR
ncbi:MAG: Sec-independent protein translocase TatB [Pseudonocardiaceae bacterium]|nr:MAG: Sec-independent protein translocase TatB [Pseudonocardiaceae bacterium]